MLLLLLFWSVYSCVTFSVVFGHRSRNPVQRHLCDLYSLFNSLIPSKEIEFYIYTQKYWTWFPSRTVVVFVSCLEHSTATVLNLKTLLASKCCAYLRIRIELRCFSVSVGFRGRLVFRRWCSSTKGDWLSCEGELHYVQDNQCLSSVSWIYIFNVSLGHRTVWLHWSAPNRCACVVSPRIGGVGWGAC